MGSCCHQGLSASRSARGRGALGARRGIPKWTELSPALRAWLHPVVLRRSTVARTARPQATIVLFVCSQAKAISPGTREAERESGSRSECSERNGPCGVWDEQQLESVAEQRRDCICMRVARLRRSCASAQHLEEPLEPRALRSHCLPGD